MQYEGIPQEQIERDLQREKTRVMKEIADKISENYDWESKTEGFSAQTVYTMELMVTSAERYYRACKSINALLSVKLPGVANEVRRLLEEMQMPDNLTS